MWFNKLIFYCTIHICSFIVYLHWLCSSHIHTTYQHFCTKKKRNKKKMRTFTLKKLYIYIYICMWVYLYLYVYKGESSFIHLFHSKDRMENLVKNLLGVHFFNFIFITFFFNNNIVIVWDNLNPPPIFTKKIIVKYITGFFLIIFHIVVAHISIFWET